MLNWALIFLVVALMAAIVGFSGLVIAAASIAKVICLLFVMLFVLSLVTGFGHRV